MYPIEKYHYLALSVILLISIFTYFADDSNVTYDLTGIVHDQKSSTNGYIFYIDTADRDIRCFCKENAEELGYYAVIGQFSDDGGIFFIEKMMRIDENNNANQD